MGRLVNSRFATYGIVAALLAAAIVMVGPAPPAHAACGDGQYVVSYDNHVVSIYNFSVAHQKLGVGCYDGNVRYTSLNTTHRGRWLSNGGTWNWSTVGPKLLPVGTQSPAAILIAGSITVGRWLKVGTVLYGGWGIWWF